MRVTIGTHIKDFISPTYRKTAEVIVNKDTDNFLVAILMRMWLVLTLRFPVTVTKACLAHPGGPGPQFPF